MILFWIVIAGFIISVIIASLVIWGNTGWYIDCSKYPPTIERGIKK